MCNTKFERNAKQLVLKYVQERTDKTDNVTITEEDVYILWSCNNNAILSTTLPDGTNYELTYNGDRDEITSASTRSFATLDNSI